jgi:hypothetical protein
MIFLQKHDLIKFFTPPRTFCQAFLSFVHRESLSMSFHPGVRPARSLDIFYDHPRLGRDVFGLISKSPPMRDKAAAGKLQNIAGLVTLPIQTIIENKAVSNRDRARREEL